MHTPHPLLRRMALAAALMGACACAQALDLTVEIKGAANTEGHVSAALFGAAEGWLKQPLVGQRQPAGDSVRLVFRNLQPGRYAVSALHDENMNGKLDSNPIGMPIERYGFSRNARGQFGPPSFADAAFELTTDQTLVITLR